MKPEVRKAAEANLIKWMNRMDPSGINGKLYQKMLPRLSDNQLIELCENYPPLYCPPNGPVKLDLKNLLKIGEELGHVWRQRVWLYDQTTGIRSLSKYKHFHADTVVRRQTQHIEDKQSMAVHTNSIDTLTGQVSGKSKTSSFSFPQAFEHFGKGEKYAMIEVLVHRGGNLDAGRALDRQIRATGSGSLNFEGSQNTRTTATVTLGGLLRGQHLGSTLLGRQAPSGG